MTQTMKPRPLTAPAQIAARTALASAGFGKSNMDPNLLNLAVGFLDGTATVLGMPMTSDRGRQGATILLRGVGIDVDAMESHYFRLLPED